MSSEENFVLKLLHPELLANEDLMKILTNLFVPLEKLKNKERDGLLKIFRNSAMPLPQRHYRNNYGGRFRKQRYMRKETIGKKSDFSVGSSASSSGRDGKRFTQPSNTRLEPLPDQIDYKHRKIQLSKSSSTKSKDSNDNGVKRPAVIRHSPDSGVKRHAVSPIRHSKDSGVKRHAVSPIRHSNDSGVKRPAVSPSRHSKDSGVKRHAVSTIKHSNDSGVKRRAVSPIQFGHNKNKKEDHPSRDHVHKHSSDSASTSKDTKHYRIHMEHDKSKKESSSHAKSERKKITWP